MQTLRNKPKRDAFTLIELMVVVAIIGLLVGILMPAFSVIRTAARNTQATAQFGALDSGITLYRNELNESLPPSASDNPASGQLIANPKGSRTPPGNGGKAEVRISGAHLLVHALIGADGLGTPGFKDFRIGGADGLWWNDTGDGATTAPYDAYAIDPATGQERRPRYGTAGFVDDKMKEATKSLADLAEAGTILNLDFDNPADDMAIDEWVFVDPWDHPILYYKASLGSKLMVADYSEDPPSAGIYRQQDNGIITGTVNGGPDVAGLDFGAGTIPNLAPPLYHAIANALAPDATDDVPLPSPAFDNSFASFILDAKITARPTPVRKDSYLFISAGPDGRYGTEDDITNWPREAP